MGVDIWVLIYGCWYMIPMVRHIWLLVYESNFLNHIWAFWIIYGRPHMIGCSYMGDHIWLTVDMWWVTCGSSYMDDHIWFSVQSYTGTGIWWVIYDLVRLSYTGPYMIICGRIWLTVYDSCVRIWSPHMNIPVYEFIYENVYQWDV